MVNLIKNRFLSLFIVILGVLLFSRCHNSMTNTGNQQPNTMKVSGMHIFSKSVKFLKLPFNDTCDDTLPIQRLSLPDSLSRFQKYGKLVGKLCETGRYTAILYIIPADVELPVLQVFDTNGNKISSLKLFIGNCCGENEGCSGLSTVQITKDLHIILKDSTQTFERNKKNLNKKRNIQTTKKTEEFRIDSTGKIVPYIPKG